MDLKLNCYPPHPGQLEFIKKTLGNGLHRDIRRTHLVCGRGWGKTLCSVLLALEAMRRFSGIKLLFLSPTYKTLHRSFMSEWERIVPSELYKYYKSDELIKLVNGSTMYLSTRYIDNPSRGKEADRGVTVNGVINDEAALGYDNELYTNVSAAVRQQQKGRFFACLTTPVLNGYQDLAMSKNHVLIHGHSMDNPYLPDDWAAELANEMSPQQYKREIEGQWVPLDGLVWPTWSDDPWPNGNIHPHVYDPSKPWYLFLDLGVANAAYLVVQRVSAEHSGLNIFGGSVWVVVGQLMPVHDGSASRAFQRLNDIYGTPCCVVGGADMTTRSSSRSGDTAMYFVREVWGDGVLVKMADGWIDDKQIQHGRLDYLINDVRGARRFCVSQEINNIDNFAKQKRGILELMHQDTWPENAGKVRGQFLAKEGRLEHVRDAALYGAVCEMAPPSFRKTKRLPG